MEHTLLQMFNVHFLATHKKRRTPVTPNSTYSNSLAVPILCNENTLRDILIYRTGPIRCVYMSMSFPGTTRMLLGSLVVIFSVHGRYTLL